MRADRLLHLLLLLQNHGRMTSRELAGKLEVSERTIFRDMEALSAAGIPVYAERGANGGWTLSEGYRTKLTGMKTEEILSLLLSDPSNLLSDLGIRKDFDGAIQKLLAESPETIRSDAEYVRQRIHVDGAGWHQSTESFPCLSTVQEAIWEERKLYIEYLREDNIVERMVHPLGLVAKRSVWYFVAEVDGDLRTYRISRLRGARILDETFQRRADFDLARYWERSIEQFKSNLPSYPALVRMDKKRLPQMDQARYAKLLSHQTMENGWVEAEIEFQTLESACEIILSFGPFLEVLAPMELRAKVKAEAQAIGLLYE